MAAKLAKEYPNITYDLFFESIKRIDTLPPGGQRDMLLHMIPWLQNVELDIHEFGDLSAQTLKVLNSLFFLTIKYGDEYVQEVQEMWINLCNSRERAEKNVLPIVRYLLNTGLAKKNSSFIAHAKKVVVYIGRTIACRFLTDILVGEIAPDNGDFGAMGETKKNQQTNEILLETVLKTDLSGVKFTRCELALILLVDLSIELLEELRPHLARLLHIIFLNMDHENLQVYEQSRQLFVNLVHSITKTTSALPVEAEKADTFMALLQSKEGLLPCYRQFLPETYPPPKKKKKKKKIRQTVLEK